jgi:uncharacterized RDD family membrane protein YckC
MEEEKNIDLKKDELLKEIGVDGKTIEYASFWIRLWAAILDNFFAGFATFFGFLVVVLIIGSLNGVSSLSDQLMNNVKFVLTIAYFIFMTYRYQATFGKKMAGVRVVSLDGGRASLSRIIIRETIGKLISFISIIGILMPLFTKRKQALHDKIAGTIVVYS